MDSMNGDIKVPSNHWNQLSREDQAAFMQLHIHFIKQQKEHFKDRKNNTFFSDISCLLQYIEYSPLRKDDRAICVGIACSGPFVCVNTQQLKIILGRCKSSINNCFQQIGYDALKTKGKSREAVLSIIPSLITEQNTLRKWTVRCASEKAMSCFVSRFPMRQLPLVGEEDLLGSLTQMGQPQISQISSANNTNNMNNTSPMNSIAGINHLNARQLNSMNSSFNMNLNLNSLNTTPNNNSMNNNVMNNNVMNNSVMNGMSYVDEQKGFQMPPIFPQQQNQSSPPPLIFGQQQFPPSRPIVLPAMTFGQSPQQPNQVPQQLQPMNFTQMNTTSIQNSRNTINNNINTNMNSNMTSKMSNSMNNNISCMNNNSFSQNHSQSQFSNNQFNNMSNNANNNSNNNQNQNQNQQSTFPQSISFEESFDIEFLSAFDNPNITANANNQSNNVTTSGNTNTRGSGGGDMFDITPSFSLNYLAEINFDEIDHDSVFDVGDSPLEPTSFFPRSQSAYLSSRFGDMPF